MKIQPLGDRILVKQVEADETTKGGIIVPDTAKEKPKQGEIVAVGAGKTLDEIAEAQGVEMEAVHEALKAARGEAMRQAIEQAVEDGKMSQEQADWMLQGLEKGWGGGRGFGRGFGHKGCPPLESE